MGARIVVGVDGSDNSHAALMWAVKEAKLRAAEVDLVHAWSIPALAYIPPSSGAMTISAADMEAVSAKVLSDAVETIRDVDGIVLRRRVAQGSPATVLLHEAKGADLLVVGTRGHGGFAGLLLGSTSQQCAHHAPCPVVIVPPPGP